MREREREIEDEREEETGGERYSRIERDRG